MLPVAVLLLAHVLVLTARSEAFAEPVHALDCKAVFAGGKAPSNLRAPSFNATLIPLCHGKGQNVYFYTVYDSTMLHGTLTAYRISPKQVQNCKVKGGRRAFQEDPQLTALGVKQVPPGSSHSGYDFNWNRGHLGPSEVFSYDKSPDGAWHQCYYTSNIAPQVGWRLLEANVYNWVVREKRDLFVLTGTWYEGEKLRKINSGIGIPDYYFKVICDGKSSAAFAGKNIEGSNGDDCRDFLSVAHWQKKTGINFHLPSECNIDTVDEAHWNFTHHHEKLSFISS